MNFTNPAELSTISPGPFSLPTSGAGGIPQPAFTSLKRSASAISGQGLGASSDGGPRANMPHRVSGNEMTCTMSTRGTHKLCHTFQLSNQPLFVFLDAASKRSMLSFAMSLPQLNAYMAAYDGNGRSYTLDPAAAQTYGNASVIDPQNGVMKDVAAGIIADHTAPKDLAVLAKELEDSLDTKTAPAGKRGLQAQNIGDDAHPFTFAMRMLGFSFMGSAQTFQLSPSGSIHLGLPQIGYTAQGTVDMTHLVESTAISTTILFCYRRISKDAKKDENQYKYLQDSIGGIRQQFKKFVNENPDATVAHADRSQYALFPAILNNKSKLSFLPEHEMLLAKETGFDIFGLHYCIRVGNIIEAPYTRPNKQHLAEAPFNIDALAKLPTSRVSLDIKVYY